MPTSSLTWTIAPRWARTTLAAATLALGMILGQALLGQSAETGPQDKPASLPKRVIIPKLTEVVAIDGTLNEPAWKKAALLTPFLRNDGSGPEREKTELRLFYDEKALYMAWTCYDTDIQATFTARDSKFWEEEVVEFFVTAKELTRYFELQWNPLGGVFDAIISNELNERGLSRKIDGDWSFTAQGMKSAVKLKGTVGNSADKDELWQIEVVIPFADLGQSAPAPGTVWRGNFYRFNRTQNQPVEQLSWSPTRLPGFHEPSRFGFLEFGK